MIKKQKNKLEILRRNIVNTLRGKINDDELGWIGSGKSGNHSLKEV